VAVDAGSVSDAAVHDAVDVRVREDGDLEECVELTRMVHNADRYPLVLPANVAAFLSSRRLIVSWVARLGGRVVGHVALHRGSSSPMASMVAESLDVEPDRIGVASRLMVSPSLRRSGVGRRLLRTAAAEAIRRGLTPALDVVTSYTAAIGLYEHERWRRIGTITLAMPDGTSVDEYVYVGPT
jgi:GNAT superfamily N-acetyltransferase